MEWLSTEFGTDVNGGLEVAGIRRAPIGVSSAISANAHLGRAEMPNTQLKMFSSNVPGISNPRVDTILIGSNQFFSSLEYNEGGIILIRRSESRQVETFIPYHRVWEIETIRD